MTFLTPIAGLIAGAIALPLLLMLYYLKLRRRPVRISSTLLWEQASRDLEVNAPLRMIRPSWSLLLHLLVLVMLCLAVARPAVEGEGEAPDEVVLLIDRSASMSASDAALDGQSVPRLDRAKREALEILDRLDGRSRAMVIAFASEPVIASPMTGNIAQATRAAEGLEATDQPGDLMRALRLVEAVGTESREQDAGESTRRIVIMSDGGDTISDEAPLRLPTGVIEFIPSVNDPESSGENHAVIACDASRDRGELSTVRLFCRVQSVNTDEREVPLSLRLNGASIASALVEMEPVEGRAGVFEGSHTFEFDDGGEGGLALVRQGLSDALASDDVFALSLTRPVGPRVMLVRGVEPDSPVDFVIEDALSVPSLRVRDLETVGIGEYDSRIPLRDGEAPRVAVVPMSDGASPDLVIFDRCTPASMPACPSVSFGGGLPIPGLNLSAPASGGSQVTFYRRTHPIMRYTDMGDLLIAGARTITLPSDSGQTTMARALAVSEDGPVVAELRHDGVRRVVVGFSLGDSTWWRRPGFPRFIKNALDELTDTGVERTDRSYTTRSAITLTPDRGVRSVAITGPTERTLEAEPGAPLNAVLPLAGVYEARGATPGTLAVNLASPEESAITARRTLDLPTRSIQGRDSSNIAPREVWHWFVLAAFALLCLEWLFYAWKIRV